MPPKPPPERAADVDVADVVRRAVVRRGPRELRGLVAVVTADGSRCILEERAKLAARLAKSDRAVAWLLQNESPGAGEVLALSVIDGAREPRQGPCRRRRRRREVKPRQPKASPRYEGARLLAIAVREDGRYRKQVAEDTGFKESELSMWINGRRRPKLDVARRIQDLLGIPMQAWTDPAKPDSQIVKTPDVHEGDESDTTLEEAAQ